MLKVSFVLVLAALILSMLAVPACGGDDDDGGTTSTTGQATTTASAQPTSTQPITTTTSDEPIKIGVLMAWSGGAAMAGLFYADPLIKVLEKQVKDMGGILGGRPVEFVRGDTSDGVSEALAAVKKLVLQDKVSVLTLGGVSPAQSNAIATYAEEEKVLFASVFGVNDAPERDFAVACTMSLPALIADATRATLEIVKPTPKTAGFLTYNDPESRELADGWKRNVEAAGVEVIYEEYIDVTVVDLASYLTKIKYKNPDVLVSTLGQAQYVSIAKQIMELGGWGDIKNVCFGNALDSAKLPGADGWIVIAPWHPALDDPESVKFRSAYETVTGKTPSEMHVYVYNTLMTAIKAIELAGTDDRVAVAKAARSGNLGFDTPMGKLRIGTDGLNNLRSIFVKIQDGKTVPFAR